VKGERERKLELLSKNGGDPVVSVVAENQLLLSNERSNSKKEGGLTLELLSRLTRVTSSKKTTDLLLYSLRRRAFTAMTCQNEMDDMAEATFYRCVKRLLAEKFLVKVMKVPRATRGRRGRGGPKPIVYAVPDYDPDEIAKAMQIHRRFKSPKFREAHKVTQLILDEYIDMETKNPEIKYMEIMEILKSRLSSVQPDLADLVAQDLNERGVKVWR